mgnify:CR=1 FL=1
MNTHILVFCATFVGIIITFSVLYTATSPDVQSYSKRSVSTSNHRSTYHHRRGEILRQKREVAQQEATAITIE